MIIGQLRGEVTATIRPALLVTKGLTIMGSLGAVISHYYRALQFVKNKRNKYPLADIVTNKYTLETATDALRAMEAGTEIKPVIIP